MLKIRKDDIMSAFLLGRGFFQTESLIVNNKTVDITLIKKSDYFVYVVIWEVETSAPINKVYKFCKYVKAKNTFKSFMQNLDTSEVLKSVSELCDNIYNKLNT